MSGLGSEAHLLGIHRISSHQPDPTVKIHLICPLRTHTLWVINETRTSQPSTT